MADEKEKDIIPVTTEPAKMKKAGFLQKCIELFVDIPEGQSIKDFIIYDKLIPGAKYLVVDTLNMMFFGSSARRPNTTNSLGTKVRVSLDQGRNEQTNYNVRRTATPGGYSFGGLTVPDQAQAQAVITAARDLITHTGDCSVRDLYKIVQYKGPTDPNDTIYGWKNLDNAFSRRYGTEWEIVFPRLTRLD